MSAPDAPGGPAPDAAHVPRGLRARGMTLRIVALQVGALSLLGALLGGISYYRSRGDLQAQVMGRAGSLTRSLARSSTLGILSGDRMGLAQLLRGLEEERLFTFAAVLDRKEVLAATGQPPDPSVLRGTAAGADPAVPSRPGANPTGLFLFTAPVTASFTGGQSSEEDLFALESGAASPGGAARQETVGWVVAGVSPQVFERDLQASLRVSAALTVAAVLVMSGLLTAVLLLSFRPLGRMTQVFRDIALGEGDLTRRVEVSSGDEIGTVGRWFNTFIDYLHGVMREVSRTILAVEGSFAALQEQQRALQEGARTQFAEVDRAGGAVERLDRSVATIDHAVGAVLDQTGRSATAVNELAASISGAEESTRALLERIESVNRSLEVMNRSLAGSAASIQGIRASGESTAAAVVQLDGAIKDIDQHTAKAFRTSEHTGTLAREGQARMGEAIVGMEEINRSFEEISGHMDAFEDQLGAAGSLLTTIGEVADRTNLLSLNAAILAAQAGVHGRGFAVLASQIKSLAGTSAKAAADIAVMLQTIGAQSRKVFAAMDDGRQRVTQGTELSQHAREALEKIAAGVADTESHVRRIVDATRDQAANSSLISGEARNLVEALEKIQEASRRQSSEAERISEASAGIRDETTRAQRALGEQAGSSRDLADSLEGIRAEQQRIHDSIRAQREGNRAILAAVATIREVSRGNVTITEDIESLIRRAREESERLRAETGRLKI